MDLIEMYPAAVNSKVTVTLGVLNADSTIIEVLDGSVLPDAPNLLVLGSDQNAETVKLTAKEGNTLTVERAIQGNAIAWPAGTQVARNFTAKDWDDIVANLNTMKTIIETDLQALEAFKGIAYTTSNKPTASDVGALKVYKDIKELGLTEATATAADIVSAMAENSMLLHTCSATANSAALAFPFNYGLLRVIKRVDNYAEFQYQGMSAANISKTTGMPYFAHYNAGSSTITWTGWIDVADASKFIPIEDNAGFHNSVYRGKYLGTAVTDAQWTAIAAGTFDDLYIGDYWTIGGINYRIAAFDYYYKAGDTSCDTHHVVLVPDTSMYTHVMNDTNITDGAYVGSKMYTEGLTQAKTTINNAFGSAHILNHRQLLCNATTNGYESGHAWYDSTVELMTEQNVYGCKIFGNQINGTGWAYNYTIDKLQYPLFTFRPDMISNRQWFWLRDVANAAYFALVSSYGDANAINASRAGGVRPAFSIC